MSGFQTPHHEHISLLSFDPHSILTFDKIHPSPHYFPLALTYHVRAFITRFQCNP